MIELTVKKFADMKKFGFLLLTFAVTQLLRVACEAGRSEEVCDLVKDMALPCTECVAVLLENCQKRAIVRREGKPIAH